MLGPALNIALTAAAVSLVIIVHEAGHFIAAKLVGMRVEVFSVGFWRKLIGFRLGETDYRLSAIPLGGYVKVSGESPEGGGGKPYEFWSKSPGQRALFIVGGVTMNFVLALVLFIVAFTVGVPFTVAEVGHTISGEPAWEAGLRPGDKIVQVGNVTDPTYLDVMRAVALGTRDVTLRVLRDGHRLTFTLTPRYDRQVGLRVIGIVPPVEPIVSGFAKIGGEEGISPAREAGIQPGDRILSVNGVPVRTDYELNLEMANHRNDEVELLVERQGERRTVLVKPEPVPGYRIGISGLTAVVEALERGGIAEAAGLRARDRITAANSIPVDSQIVLEDALTASLGTAMLQVQRDGELRAVQVNIADPKGLRMFSGSVEFTSSSVLTWVKSDGPAWKAGMRPGDRVVSVGGHEVSTWEEILARGSQAKGEEHEIQWERDGELVTGLVLPVKDTAGSSGQLGIWMGEERMEPRRYGVVGAVRAGAKNTVGTIAELLLTVRGFATRQVSTRQLGGIVTIVYASYYAAEQGIGKLLYLTAIISAAIAFMNVLPIPVLDGGHLLFLAIEKLRGRRLGERALTVSQAIGIVVLVLLVVFVTRNDIIRWLQKP